jgi:hypothetical protein
MSIAGCELSRIMVTDFVQLAPDRTASLVSKSPTELEVSLLGPSFTVSAAGHTAEVWVSVEKRVQPGNDHELAWVPASDKLYPLVIDPQFRNQGGLHRWVGSIKLPAARGTAPFRVVIREYELFQTDPGGLQMNRPVEIAKDGLGKNQTTADNARLTYVDTIVV